MEKIHADNSGMKAEVPWLEKIFNDDFVAKIISLSIDDYNIRKSTLGRLKMSDADCLSKDNMKKIFLRCYAKAFERLYGSNQVYG